MSEIRHPIVDDAFATTIVITAVDGNVLRVASHPSVLSLQFFVCFNLVVQPNEEPDQEN